MLILFLVTSLVTHFESFKLFKNSVQLHWKRLIRPAMRLELVMACKHQCENGQIYLFKTLTILDQKITFLSLPGLSPGSHFQFTLKAVYNPASLDKGISITFMVLPASKTSSHIHVHVLHANFFTRYIVLCKKCNNSTIY